MAARSLKSPITRSVRTPTRGPGRAVAPYLAGSRVGPTRRRSPLPTSQASLRPFKHRLQPLSSPVRMTALQTGQARALRPRRSPVGRAAQGLQPRESGGKFHGGSCELNSEDGGTVSIRPGAREEVNKVLTCQFSRIHMCVGPLLTTAKPYPLSRYTLGSYMVDSIPSVYYPFL